MHMTANAVFPDKPMVLSSDFNSGPAGPQGPAGPAGADGYTPVKGVDYFTEADKAEMLDGLKEHSYTKQEIDAIMGAYVTDIDTLIGGEA